jgi:hypothetical protein
MKKPDNILFDYSRFQIGQCRINVQIWRAEDFYKAQPKITDNCQCDDCSYYQNFVAKMSNPFFDLLKSMGVDLTRQPNINPDGICCVGDVGQNSIGYMGYYLVYGQFGQTSKANSLIDDEGNGVEVSFKNAEYGKGISFTVKKVDDTMLSFDFYITVQKGDHSSS